MNRRLLQYVDFPLLSCALLLAAIGSLAVFSASHGNGTFLHKQLICVAVSLVAMIVMALVNYEWFDRLSVWVYVGNLLLLIAVFVIGRSVRGSQRWFSLGGFQFQASEFAKLFLTLALASLLVRCQTKINDPLTLVKAFALIALPALIVFKQPHLGNTLMLVAILFGMLYMAGAKVSHLALAAALGLGCFALAWKTDRINAMQKRRWLAFVSADGTGLKDENWQSFQSKVAIGSGGATGQGFMRGSQNQLGFVPDNHTDFILALIGEEFGFAGTATVLGLLFVLLWRTLALSRETEVLYGALVASGLFVWLACQSFVNAGMTMQIMPVVGLPLPMVSYGGSSMLASFMSIGILQSIAMRRRKMVF